MATEDILVNTMIYLANLHVKNVCHFQKLKLKKKNPSTNIFAALGQLFSWNALIGV